MYFVFLIVLDLRYVFLLKDALNHIMIFDNLQFTTTQLSDKKNKIEWTNLFISVTSDHLMHYLMGATKCDS